MKNAYLSTFLLLINSILLSQSENVYFESGSYNLSGQQSELNMICESAVERQDTLAVVVGHTDNIGSPKVNNKLAQKRSQAVSDVLIQHGITVLFVTKAGESYPGFSNETAEGRAKNRRVEMFFGGDADELARMFPYPSEYKSENETDFFRANRPNLLFFRINADRGGSFVGPKGTYVKIPPRALENWNGELATGMVDIYLAEYYDLDDMILSGISTNYGDSFIETGGTIYLEGQKNGERLRLKEGREIELSFKKNEQQVGMRTFRASNNFGGWIDWELDSVSVDRSVTTSSYSGGPAVWITAETHWARDSVLLYEINALNGTFHYDTTMERISPQEWSYRMSSRNLTVSGMGWINCDAFGGQMKEWLTVRGSAIEKESITLLLFKNRNAVMAATKIVDGIAKFRVPEGEEVEVLVMRQYDGEMGFVQLKETSGSKEVIVDDLDRYSEEELRERLKHL